MATFLEEEETIHERLLQLKQAALSLPEEDGGRLSDRPLVRLGYDCLLDALDAVYRECHGSGSLSKDKNVSRFLKKCKRGLGQGLILLYTLVPPSVSLFMPIFNYYWDQAFRSFPCIDVHVCMCKGCGCTCTFCIKFSSCVFF